LDVTDEQELKTLSEEWETGKLQALSGYLLEFIDRHRDEILKLAGTSKSAGKRVEAFKKLVRQRGYIHLPLDMADQIHEINNEIWYQGEKGDFNRQKIKEIWTVKHASTWRRWRVKQILYIIDRRSDEVAAHLMR
jgi:hypothetical protein